MIVKLLLLCYVLVQINGDVETDIRNEEEKRHNATLTSYLKAAVGGVLLHSLFPKVTDQEKAEADKWLADAFPLGDPSVHLPDNDEKIETNLCRSHKERGVKILAYARKRWPTHLITQVTIRLSMHAMGDRNDWYCKDAATRSVYTTNASVVNTHVNDLNVARNKFIDNMGVVVHGNASNNLAILCCSAWIYKAQSVNAVPLPVTKHFIEEYITGYIGAASKYLCVHHSEGSKACANLVIPPPPANIPRFNNVLASCLETISKLTSLQL